MSDSAYFIALIPLVWLALSWLLSQISGWSKLSVHYRAGNANVEESARMRTGRIGVINYHSCLTFGVNDQGLRIAVAFPLRLGHPPMFIPWQEFHHIAKDKVRYSQKVRVAVGRPMIARMVLPGWVRYRMPLEMRAGI